MEVEKVNGGNGKAEIRDLGSASGSSLPLAKVIKLNKCL